MISNDRLQRGHEIARATNQIQRVDSNTYKVKSQSNSNNIYDVLATELGWTCSCPDHMYRGVTCKHIHAVEFSLQIRKTVETQVIIKSVDIQACPNCN